MAKTLLKDLDLQSLIEYEKASELVCHKYENVIRRYDGTLNSDGEECDKFYKYNEIRENVLKEIEKRLDTIN